MDYQTKDKFYLENSSGEKEKKQKEKRKKGNTTSYAH